MKDINLKKIKIICPYQEAETIIQISKDGRKANIYTTDNIMWTKIRHCIENNPFEWNLLDIKHYAANSDSKLVGQVSSIEVECPKKYVSFRKVGKTANSDGIKLALNSIMK